MNVYMGKDKDGYICIPRGLCDNLPASMLNKNGKGTLYFGVRNDGEIVGQQIGDRTMREISLQQLRRLVLSISDSIVNIEANNQELTFEQLKTLYAGNNLTLRKNTFKYKKR